MSFILKLIRCGISSSGDGEELDVTKAFLDTLAVHLRKFGI